MRTFPGARLAAGTGKPVVNKTALGPDIASGAINPTASPRWPHRQK